MTVRNRWLLAAALLGATGGCDSAKPPAGQVVARVGGDEITIHELAVEMRARNMANADGAARSAILKDIVDRRILAKLARGAGLDETQDYLLGRRRADDLLLAGLYASRLDGLPPASPAMARRAAADAAALDARTIFVVESVRFATAAGGAADRASGATDPADLVRILSDAGASPVRRIERWDSLQLPAALADMLLANRPGRPFVFTGVDPAVAGFVLDSRPAPLDAAQRDAVIADRVRRERLGEAIAAASGTTRSRFPVSYQTGYEPVKSVAE